MRDTLQTEIGPFAMVPVWIIETAKDANAIAVYAVLARHANRERRAWPGQDRIAGVLGVSVDTVERGMRILREIGAIVTEPRRQDGVIVGTSYVLLAKSSIKSNPSRMTDRSQAVAVESAASTSGPVTGEARRASRVTGKVDQENQIQEPEQDTEQDAVVYAIERWRDRWHGKYGHAASLIASPVVFSDVAKQVQQIGLDGWTAALDGYFASTDEYAARVKHALGPFAKDPNRWRVTVAKPVATTANGVRQQTREANAAHVADGRLQGILARDNPDLFKGTH